MAWEIQPGGRRYYTRSRRVAGGRIVREYVGKGVVAELSAAVDALARQHRRAEAEARRAEETRLVEAAIPLQELCAGTDLLAHAALIAGGYHQHDRGGWRRRRNGNQD